MTPTELAKAIYDQFAAIAKRSTSSAIDAMCAAGQALGQQVPGLFPPITERRRPNHERRVSDATTTNGALLVTLTEVAGTPTPIQGWWGMRRSQRRGGVRIGPPGSSPTAPPGSVTKLAMSTQPAGAVDSTLFGTGPVVKLQDANSADVIQAGVAITASINSGSGALSGTLTVQTTSGGIAPFTDLKIVGSGAHTLAFAASGLTGVNSSSFTVAAITKLAMVTQPAGAVDATIFTVQPAVRLQDATSVSGTKSGVAVAAAIGTGTGTLSGTLSANTDASGVATFTNLKIDLLPVPSELSLNGTWGFVPQGGALTTIAVPEFWDAAPGHSVSSASYRKTVNPSASWAGQRIKVEFESVHHYCDVYVNDTLVGSHTGAWTPFAIDITDQVTPGTAFTLRVEVKGGDQAPIKDGGGVHWPIGDRGTVRQWGIGDDVWLRAYGVPVHITQTLIHTSVALDQITVEYTLKNTDAGTQVVDLVADVLDSGGSVVKALNTESGVSLTAGEVKVVTVTTSWTNPTEWTPTTPTLYTLRNRVMQGVAIVDTRTQRFGFREFTVSGTQFYLNGVRTNLYGDGVLSHAGHFNSSSLGFGRYTVMTSATWPTQVDLFLSKNVRCVRFHSQPPPRFVLDTADEKGLLVLLEGALYPDSDSQYWPLASDYLTNAATWWGACVKRFHNHPSVIMWGAANEFGPPYYNVITGAQMKTLQDAIRAADIADRPVMSDGDQGVTDAAAENYHYPEGYQNTPPGNTSNWATLLSGTKPTGVGEFLISGAGQAWWQGVWTYPWWHGTWCRRLRYLNFSDVRPFTLEWLWAGPTTAPPRDNLKNSFAPIALFDKAYYELGIGPPQGSYPSVAASSTQNRTLVLYNDEWAGTSIVIQAKIVKSGVETDVYNDTITLALGAHVDVPYTFTAPTSGPFDLVLTTTKSGVQRFTESLRFNVS